MRRILAIRLDNIGDVVMTGPALRTLKQSLPGVRLTMMVSNAGAKVAPLLPWIDETIVWRSVWQDASWSMPLDPARELSLIETIRAGRYDAAVIFTSFSQSPYPPAYVCYLAGVPIRVGQSKEFGGSVLSQWVKSQPDGWHQVDRNLYLLEQAGFEPAGSHLELHVPDEAQAGADRLLREAGIDPLEPFIVAAPGASCSARRYDPLRFGEAARMLSDLMPVVVVGAERDREVASFLLGRGIRSLVGRDTVPELAGILRRARLVIANNSGPMHIADAFARPMVILYSGTELEEQWRPRGSPVKLLRRNTHCSPCYAFTCPYGMECLDIPPEEVSAHALELLEQEKACIGCAF